MLTVHSVGYRPPILQAGVGKQSKVALNSSFPQSPRFEGRSRLGFALLTALLAIVLPGCGDNKAKQQQDKLDALSDKVESLETQLADATERLNKAAEQDERQKAETAGLQKQVDTLKAVALREQQVRARIQKSTVTVVAESSTFNGPQESGFGSMFMVQDAKGDVYAPTAAHVFRQLVDPGSPHVSVTMKAELFGDQTFTIKPEDVVVYSEEADVALIRLPQAIQAYAKEHELVLMLEDTSKPSHGKQLGPIKVVSGGTHLGNERSVVTGVLSSWLDKGRNRKRTITTLGPVIATDADIAQGVSGGPLANAFTADVLAINVQLDTERGGLGYGASVTTLKELALVEAGIDLRSSGERAKNLLDGAQLKAKQQAKAQRLRVLTHLFENEFGPRSQDPFSDFTRFVEHYHNITVPQLAEAVEAEFATVLAKEKLTLPDDLEADLKTAFTEDQVHMLAWMAREVIGKTKGIIWSNGPHFHLKLDPRVIRSRMNR